MQFIKISLKGGHRAQQGGSGQSLTLLLQLPPVIRKPPPFSPQGRLLERWSIGKFAIMAPGPLDPRYQQDQGEEETGSFSLKPNSAS